MKTILAIVSYFNVVHAETKDLLKSIPDSLLAVGRRANVFNANKCYNINDLSVDYVVSADIIKLDVDDDGKTATKKYSDEKYERKTILGCDYWIKEGSKIGYRELEPSVAKLYNAYEVQLIGNEAYTLIMDVIYESLSIEFPESAFSHRFIETAQRGVYDVKFDETEVVDPVDDPDNYDEFGNFVEPADDGWED